MKTVVVRRSRDGGMPSRNCSARDAISGFAGAYSALEGGNYHISDIEPELLVEFTNSCRTRDVDLGDESPDHVDADEHHSLGGERRADFRGQPAIALGELAAHTLRAGREIAAVVGGQRNAGEGRGDGLG